MFYNIHISTAAIFCHVIECNMQYILKKSQKFKFFYNTYFYILILIFITIIMKIQNDILFFNYIIFKEFFINKKSIF